MTQAAEQEAAAVPTIRAIEPTDRDAWEPLWNAYLAFYRTELPATTTDLTWRRLTSDDPQMGAFVAVSNDVVTGFLHYVLHPTTWTTAPACYLEDLFVAQDQRGTGCGRALIERLVWTARREAWSGIHWITAHENITAMQLYDRVATRTDWVRYEINLAD